MAEVTRYCHIGSQRGRVPTQVWAGANQPIHWFLGGEGLGIQQGWFAQTHRCGQEGWTVKEAWEGRDGTQPNEEVI